MKKNIVKIQALCFFAICGTTLSSPVVHASDTFDQTQAASSSWLGRWEHDGSVIEIRKERSGEIFASGELNGGGTGAATLVFELDRARVMVNGDHASVAFDGVEDKCPLGMLKKNNSIVVTQKNMDCFGRVAADGTYTRAKK